MQVERLNAEEVHNLGGPDGVARHLRSLVADGESVSRTVSEILREVRDDGDAAVLRYTSRFDAPEADPKPLRVGAAELDEAIKQLPLDVVAGLQVAIANVAAVADAGVDESVAVELTQGQRVTLREVPVRAAAVYVPGGRAPYPSTVVMGVVTARAAGVLDVAVCSPPGSDGEIHPATLGACRLCGVERVYRMGGAQAIGALAYGTETVDRVDVIVGPGNLYVQEAKLQLSHIVGIDGFAGPSDLLILFGPDADPSLVALDLAAQAEHGTGSLVVGLSVSKDALDRLAGELELLAGRYPDLRPAACVLIEISDAREGLALANEFAPEHLELIGAVEEGLAPMVQSAGCLFVGSGAATAFGDYVVGSNHILPTAGCARFSSSLSARHFRRRMPEVRVPRPATKLARAGSPIAEIEGFRVHAESMRARIGENEEQ
ncbi:MAG TPA: histidinol dehydrogenase [Solirubrobacteraceae bacterium]